MHLFMMIIGYCSINIASADLKLLILHTNDLHSHLEEFDKNIEPCEKSEKCYGGFARLKKTVDDIREKQKGKRHVIHLNAGDNFQGTPYYSLFKWKVVADFIDDLQFDVMSLGNSEFVDGIEGLAPYLKAIKTVSVCANIDTSSEPSLKCDQLQKFKILDVNGTKIGIIGYLTPATSYLQIIRKLKFSDELNTINEEIIELKKQGIKIFIALGHSGYDVDKYIARYLPDIDVIVGGHTNTFLYTGSPPDLEKQVSKYPKIIHQNEERKVPVVQAFAYGKYLGCLEVDFDDNGEMKSFGGNAMLLSSNLPEDESMLKKIKKWKDKMEPIVSEVIGTTKVNLKADLMACRLRECNLGNLVTDAFIETNSLNYVGEGWTDAPMAITHGGGIRYSTLAPSNGENITVGHIITILPSNIDLFKVKITGEDLRQALEQSVSRFDHHPTIEAATFLQVSGIRVLYDINEIPGMRVKIVRVRCGKCKVPIYSDLKDSEIYGLILTRFLLNNGVILNVFKERTTDQTFLNTTDTDAVIKYIRKNSPVNPKGSRIVLRNKTDHLKSLNSSTTNKENNPFLVILLMICFHYHVYTVYGN